MCKMLLLLLTLPRNKWTHYFYYMMLAINWLELDIDKAQNTRQWAIYWMTDVDVMTAEEKVD